MAAGYPPFLADQLKSATKGREKGRVDGGSPALCTQVLMYWFRLWPGNATALLKMSFCFFVLFLPLMEQWEQKHPRGKKSILFSYFLNQKNQLTDWEQTGVSEWLVRRTWDRITLKDTWYQTKWSSVGILKSHRWVGDGLLSGRRFLTFKPVSYHVSFALRKKVSHEAAIVLIISVIIF